LAGSGGHKSTVPEVPVLLVLETGKRVDVALDASLELISRRERVVV